MITTYGRSFRNAASTSITYTLMSRCGIDPEQYFGHEDFLSVFDWNTPAAVSALGTAVSEVSEQVLRHIEVTIKRYEREKITERSQNHGEQADLYTERGLSDPGPEVTEEPEGGTAGQVRRMRRQHLKEHRPTLFRSWCWRGSCTRTCGRSTRRPTGVCPR